MSTPIIPDEFMEWFRKNYPGPDTIIYKPDWHAPRVYQAAIHASRSDPTQDARVQALEAENSRLREAGQAVVDEYPVSAGTSPGLCGDECGYGSIYRLRAALRDLEGGK